MKLINFLQGVEILRTHYKDPDGHHLCAEHDEIYLTATDSPLSDAEVAQIKALGWFQPDTGVSENYDPELCWCAFI